MSAIIPPPLSAEERADLDAWCDELSASALASIDADASPESFRDDGTLHHGRFPSEDIDPFNPWITATARPQLIPPRPQSEPANLLLVWSRP